MCSAPHPRKEQLARPASGPRVGGAPTGRRPWWRRRRALLVSAAILVLLPGAGFVALQLPPVREALRARAAAALAERVPAARLEGDARVDPLFRIALGPLTVPARRPGAPPLLHADRVVVRLRLWALLWGRAEAAAVRLDGVRLEAGPRGEGLAELRDALRAGPARRGREPAGEAAPPVLAFTDLVVNVARGPAHGGRGARLELGPLSGRLHLAREGAGLAADLGVRGPGAARARLQVRWGGAATSFSLEVRDLGPEAIPGPLRARLPLDLAGGAVDLRLDAPSLPAGPTAGVAALELEVRDARVASPRLDPEPVGPFDGRLTGQLRWDAPRRRLALEGGRVTLGRGGRAGAALALTLDGATEPRWALDLRADALDWGAAVAALPRALAPPADAPALRGALRARLSVEGPLRRPSAWRLDGEIDPRGLRAAPGSGSVLGGAFTWEAPRHDGGTRAVLVAPENPRFVPLGALPPYLVRAVLASEDAGFYGHHGFDLAEIQDALAHAGERRRLRGASTITQQLAKNLYLSRERTLARKGREALATLALEAAVGKRRLLEIYLNVVEWGPEVNGIGEAAHHWFGKDARELDPKEAAFLATVIPNPVRFDMYRRRGALTPAWEARVHDLLQKLRQVDALDDAQLQRAWDEPLAFAGAAGPGAQASGAGRGAGSEGLDAAGAPLPEEDDPPPPGGAPAP